MATTEYTVPALLASMPAGPTRQEAARGRWPQLVPQVDAAIATPTRARRIPAAALGAAYLMVDPAIAAAWAALDPRAAAQDALATLAPTVTASVDTVRVVGSSIEAAPVWAALDARDPALRADPARLATDECLREAAARIAELLTADLRLTAAPSALAVLDAVLEGNDARYGHRAPGMWFRTLAAARPDVLAGLAPVGLTGLLALCELDRGTSWIVSVLEVLAITPAAAREFVASFPHPRLPTRWVSAALLLVLDRVAGDDAVELLTRYQSRIHPSTISNVLTALEHMTAPALRAWAIEAVCVDGAGTIRYDAEYDAARPHLTLARLGTLVSDRAQARWFQDASSEDRRAWLRSTDLSTVCVAVRTLHGGHRAELLDEAFEELAGVFAVRDAAVDLTVFEPLMARVAAELETHPHGWTLFWQLAPTWQGTAAALVATVQAATA